MNPVSFCIVDELPEPAFTALAAEAFADYTPSAQLAEVLDAEAALRSGPSHAVGDGALRIGAFRDGALVGWAFGRREGANIFHMINAGVAPAERRQGVYSGLARLVIEHARSQGHVAIQSRHAAGNNPIIVAKLKLGFVVSGFEYSEVYGPLVRLTLLLGEQRRALYQARAAPIRRAAPG